MRTLVRKRAGSQSPDGDFFDPERVHFARRGYWHARHSPLTGIFLIRRGEILMAVQTPVVVTVP